MKKIKSLESFGNDLEKKIKEKVTLDNVIETYGKIINGIRNHIFNSPANCMFISNFSSFLTEA